MKNQILKIMLVAVLCVTVAQGAFAETIEKLRITQNPLPNPLPTLSTTRGLGYYNEVDMGNMVFGSPAMGTKSCLFHDKDHSEFFEFNTARSGSGIDSLVTGEDDASIDLLIQKGMESACEIARIAIERSVVAELDGSPEIRIVKISKGSRSRRAHVLYSIDIGIGANWTDMIADLAFEDAEMGDKVKSSDTKVLTLGAGSRFNSYVCYASFYSERHGYFWGRVSTSTQEKLKIKKEKVFGPEGAKTNVATDVKTCERLAEALLDDESVVITGDVIVPSQGDITILRVMKIESEDADEQTPSRRNTHPKPGNTLPVKSKTK